MTMARGFDRPLEELEACREAEEDRLTKAADSKFQTELAQIWSPQVLGELQAVADCASRLDVLWGNDEDEECDDAEFCETMTELRKVLRPWRERRALTSDRGEKR